MALDPDLMFEQRHITDPLIRALHLPPGVFYLVVDEDFRTMHFLDAQLTPHTRSLPAQAEPVLRLAAEQRKQSMVRHDPYSHAIPGLVEI